MFRDCKQAGIVGSQTSGNPKIPFCLTQNSGISTDGVGSKLPPHGSVGERDEREPSHALLFQRPDEPLDDTDAGRFAKATITRADASPLAPALERSTPELAAAIRDDVTGRVSAAGDRAFQELLDLVRVGRGVEYREVPMTTRDTWSTTTATHQLKGQRGGRESGSQGTQSPERIGTAVRSRCHV